MNFRLELGGLRALALLLVKLSLGGLNYCLKILIDKGRVNMQNIQNSKNKFKYFYLLTPQGIAKKVTLTSRFLECKRQEYDALKADRVFASNVRAVGWQVKVGLHQGLAVAYKNFLIS